MLWSSILLYTFRLNERDHDRVDCVDGARGHHENEEEETIRQVEKASRQKERAHTAELRLQQAHLHDEQEKAKAKGDFLSSSMLTCIVVRCMCVCVYAYARTSVYVWYNLLHGLYNYVIVLLMR